MGRLATEHRCIFSSRSGEAELRQFLTVLSLNPEPSEITATEALSHVEAVQARRKVNSRKARVGTGGAVNQS
jgi:hypothetical protein